MINNTGKQERRFAFCSSFIIFTLFKQEVSDYDKKKSNSTVDCTLLADHGRGCLRGGGDSDMSQSRQENPYENLTDEQLDHEVEKLKEEGIVDENGVPAPGVDLNNYPGRG